MISFLWFMISGTLECIGVVALSMALAYIQLDWIRSFKVGIILALIIFTIRRLPIFLGFHTLIALFILVAYIWHTYQIPLVRVFLASMISISIIGLLEYINIYFLTWFLHINVMDINNNYNMKRCMWFFPQYTIAILLAYLCNQFNIKKTRNKLKILNLL